MYFVHLVFIKYKVFIKYLKYNFGQLLSLSQFIECDFGSMFVFIIFVVCPRLLLLNNSEIVTVNSVVEQQ